MFGEHAGTERRESREWWRVGFGSGLALALLVGLYVSLWTGQPAQVPDPSPPAAEETEAAGEPEDEPVAEEPEVVEEPTVDPDELIAAAAEPSATSVQVLDAGGGGGATQRAAQALRDLGYDVVNLTSSRRNVFTTTILFTDDNEPQAEALRARDDRFAAIEANQTLSTGVDLHVLVGPDWR